jgi:hypothetical protein
VNLTAQAPQRSGLFFFTSWQADSRGRLNYIVCMPIDFKQLNSANDIKLEIRGTLDEKGMLPSISDGTILRLDFNGVTGMNSIGIRNFIQWGEVHKNLKSIRLENCPPLMAQNFSRITGFLRSNMKVMSFYVPFYSDKTDERSDYLFVRGRDFDDQGHITMPTVKDSEGHTMMVDVNTTSFFEFLLS